MYGKSQSSLLVLLAIVVTFIILWLFFTFLRIRGGVRVVREVEVEKLASYLNTVKGYSHEALLSSVHPTAQEAAGSGGEITKTGMVRSWICDGVDVSPSVEEVRYFLSEKTKERLNDYIENFKIKDLPEIRITDYGCVDYDVNDESVFSGKNDEKFNVGAYGSEASVKYKEDNVSSSNDVYESVSQVRFWYLYRNFKDWSREEASRFSSCVCQCTGLLCGCESFEKCKDCRPFYSCLQQCVNDALEKLKSKFDEYVECKATIICCEVEKGDPCETVRPSCSPWNSKKCGWCEIERAGKLCIEDYVLNYGAGPADECTGECVYWYPVRSAVNVDFSCTDKKYMLSTKGSRELKFVVDVSNRAEVPCIQKADCICSPDNECVCPLPVEPCTDCLGNCEYKEVSTPGGSGSQGTGEPGPEEPVEPTSTTTQPLEEGG